MYYSGLDNSWLFIVGSGQAEVARDQASASVETIPEGFALSRDGPFEGKGPFCAKRALPGSASSLL